MIFTGPLLPLTSETDIAALALPTGSAAKVRLAGRTVRVSAPRAGTLIPSNAASSITPLIKIVVFCPAMLMRPSPITLILSVPPFVTSPKI